MVMKVLLGNQISHRNSPIKVAKTMSLFVAAFFLQWGAVFVHGIWSMTGKNIPQTLFHIVTITANLGGVFNLCVYFIIKRRQRMDECKRQAFKHTEQNSEGHRYGANTVDEVAAAKFAFTGVDEIISSESNKHLDYTDL